MQNKDLLWKGIIEDLIEDFLQFFYPDDFPTFDFTKPVEFLDQELAMLNSETELSNRYVDKLIRVHLKGGGERWILIHVEVQGYFDADFPERMFIYWYRIWDRYGVDVASLAILTDGSRNFRPYTYHKGVMGSSITFVFQSYKVLDQDEEILRKSTNPFALAILATLMELKHGKKRDQTLWGIKRKLAQLMYERNYFPEKQRDLFNFMNYYIVFANKEKTLNFAKEIIATFQPSLLSKNMGIQELLLEQALQEGIEIGVEKGVEKGVLLGASKKERDMVLAAHKKGLSIDLIAEITGLTPQKVIEILKQENQL